MVIEPDEASKLEEAQISEIERLERCIDAGIKENYIPGSRVSLSLSKELDYKYLNGKVRSALHKKYTQAGWEVKWEEEKNRGQLVFNYIALNKPIKKRGLLRKLLNK